MKSFFYLFIFFNFIVGTSLFSAQDTCEQSTIITTGTTTATINKDTDRNDYYIFSPGQPGKLTVTLTTNDKIQSDYGYACDSSTLGFLNRTNAGTSTLGPIDVNGSDIYIHLYDDGKTVNYDLNITFTAVPVVNPPIVTLNGSMDAIEASSFALAGSSYAPANKNIFTKQVKKPFSLEVVYLDVNGVEQLYNGTIGSKTVDMAVTLYTTDTPTCTQENQLIWTGAIAHNTSHITATIDGTTTTSGTNSYLLNSAAKDEKIKVMFIDYGTLINAASDLSCSASSLDSSLCLVPACLNSDTQILRAFPVEQYPHVTTCLYGDGGGASPCDSSAYTGSCGGKKTTISPSKYNHDTGCAACLADALNMNGCSTDNFATRPELFSVTSANAHFPDLFRAGVDYNTTINAYNYNTTINTSGYTVANVSNASADLNMTTTKYNKNNAIDNSMTGVATFASTPFDMLNGISVKTAVVGNEVAGIKFSDVGKVSIRIEDRTWAAVDNDDTPMTCDANGTYVCGELNATFIPHHFDFNGSSISNGIGTFTYLANERDQMNARIDANISALSGDGNITQNFAPFPLYENPISVTPVVIKNEYIYPDANESNITDLTLGFNSGVLNLPSNDANISRNLVFNFRRDLNATANPFMVTGNDLNVTASSVYTGTAPEGTATIQGASIMSMDGNATFIYGRTNAPRQIITGNAGNVFIYYEAHCSGTDSSGIVCDKTLLPNGVDSNSTNDPRWFVNANHTSAATSGETGSITQKNGLNIVTLNGTATLNSGVTTAPLLYNETRGYPYSTTMENNASDWLIYNKNNINATSNEFEVEFINPNSSWAGIRENNTTTNSNAAPKTNRRVMW